VSCCRGVACIEQLLGCDGLLPTGQVQDGLEDRIRVAEEGYQMLSARPANQFLMVRSLAPVQRIVLLMARWLSPSSSRNAAETVAA
jgi:hypothetical protein